MPIFVAEEALKKSQVEVAADFNVDLKPQLHQVKSPDSLLENFLEDLEMDLGFASTGTLDSWFLVPLKFVQMWRTNHPLSLENSSLTDIEDAAIMDIRKML